MALSVTTYDPVKIDKLRHLLEDMSQRGQARFYEIFVDNLKVVPKTDLIDGFDCYEFYIGEDTEKLRIVIYDSASSPRNNQYVFTIKASPQANANSLNGMDNIIQEKLAAREKEYELGRTKAELEGTKKQLQEAEEYVTQLEEQLELAKSNKYKLGNLDLVELGGLALENLARKNSSLLGKIGLGGFDTKEDEEIPEELNLPSTSFRKKTTPEPPVEEHAYMVYAPVLESLEQAFNPDELTLVMQILQRLSEMPQQLPTVAELLNL
ncbi:MAG TPA: hypothetical protein VJ552_05865 [Sediminibacterium sp.]|nr:hypothetical protein [Sediminibacterium sp.]